MRKKKFVECAVLDNQKGLSEDVSIRWNFTFLILQGAFYYRRVFLRLRLSDSNYKHCPIKEEWDRAEENSKFLEFFTM